MTTNRQPTPQSQTAGVMPRLLTLRDVTAATALSRSAVYALMAESRFPKPDPHRQPGGPVGRAGSARLHRQPSPSRLRSARRVAGTIRGPHDRQHEEPAVSNGRTPAVGTGSWSH